MKHVVFCSRVEEIDPSEVFPGALKKSCEICNSEIYITAATNKATKEFEPVLICYQCATKHKISEKVSEFRIAEESIIEWLRNHK